MIFLSAGHHFDPRGADPGAVNEDGIKEADLTRELRDLVVADLHAIGASVITDKDSETLSRYIRRIRPGSGSVVCELHFNAARRLATGTEVLVKDHYSISEKQLGLDICNAVAQTCGIYNRGVKREKDSHRRYLAILHTPARISVLPEICFITNRNDLTLYDRNKKLLAHRLALLLKKHDDLYT